MDWKDRITVTPGVRSGMPCIRNTRITVYDVRLDSDAALTLHVHDKKTQSTPKDVLDACRARAERYDRDAKGER